ncbi:MAG: hypothetical protein JWO08_4457 [Verrucomicrobiaceae bacterium]|nr:hypothetical protein [Verrucomicrobiaceae bacterium]
MHTLAAAYSISDMLGLQSEAQELTFSQVCLRGVVIFVAGLLMVRVADKRFYAKKSAFDILLALVLGSTLGRAINGSERLFETIGVCFLLVLIHRLMGFAACRYPSFEKIVKGHTNTLVKEGQVLKNNLYGHHLSEEDLNEQLRLQGNASSAEEVALACLERSGEISVIKKEKSS